MEHMRPGPHAPEPLHTRDRERSEGEGVVTQRSTHDNASYVRHDETSEKSVTPTDILMQPYGFRRKGLEGEGDEGALDRRQAPMMKESETAYMYRYTRTPSPVDCEQRLAEVHAYKHTYIHTYVRTYVVLSLVIVQPVHPTGTPGTEGPWRKLGGAATFGRAGELGLLRAFRLSSALLARSRLLLLCTFATHVAEGAGDRCKNGRGRISDAGHWLSSWRRSSSSSSSSSSSHIHQSSLCGVGEFLFDQRLQLPYQACLLLVPLAGRGRAAADWGDLSFSGEVGSFWSCSANRGRWHWTLLLGVGNSRFTSGYNRRGCSRTKSCGSGSGVRPGRYSSLSGRRGVGAEAKQTTALARFLPWVFFARGGATAFRCG